MNLPFGLNQVGASLSPEAWALIGFIIVIFECLGVISAIQAIFWGRTSQGSIAWALALITWPIFSVPLFWVFGRNKFNGYISARRSRNRNMLSIIKELDAHASEFQVDLGRQFGDARVLENLSHLPFYRGNNVGLLVDGESTFNAIFAAIDQAQDYILAEFFIVRDDQLGCDFKDHLIAAAKRGCNVFLLYDDVGSRSLSNSYLHHLRASGVKVTGMNTTRGITNRFQVNFRNHRKMVIVDGKQAFVGGFNVGDEYVGRHKRLTPWRDTKIHFEGPAVLAAQIAFLEDWQWAAGSIPQLNWELRPPHPANKTIIVLPSGPDDVYDTCGLLFTHAINTAEDRIWIASPYFVPDEGIVTALALAVMRGVDVRLLIPGIADKWFVKRAAMAFVPQVLQAGVKVYEYGRGFMHQKVLLLDDRVSVIGTANLDNRSFRLNFEINVVTIDASFTKVVEAMLIQDFSDSKLMNAQEIADRGLFFQVSSRIARLFAPIL